MTSCFFANVTSYASQFYSKHITQHDFLVLLQSRFPPPPTLAYKRNFMNENVNSLLEYPVECRTRIENFLEQLYGCIRSRTAVCSDICGDQISPKKDSVVVGWYLSILSHMNKNKTNTENSYYAVFFKFLPLR